VDCVLKLWKDGFSVDDGPLRDFKDQTNQEFLSSISKGYVYNTTQHFLIDHWAS